MTRFNGKKSGRGLLTVGLLAGMLFLLSQKNLPAQEPGAGAGTAPGVGITQLSNQGTGRPLTTPATPIVAPGTKAPVEISNDNLSDGVPQTGLRTVDMFLAGRIFQLEVAETPDQEQIGLMYRTHLPARHGMLFPFQPPRAVNFWMKNTRIPLDMVFMRRNQVLHIAHHVPPCKADPCPSYSSVYPVDMVVELPADTAKQDGIEPGLQATLQVSGQAPQAPSQNPGQGFKPQTPKEDDAVPVAEPEDPAPAAAPSGEVP